MNQLIFVIFVYSLNIGLAISHTSNNKNQSLSFGIT